MQQNDAGWSSTKVDRALSVLKLIASHIQYASAMRGTPHLSWMPLLLPRCSISLCLSGHYNAIAICTSHYHLMPLDLQPLNDAELESGGDLG